MDVITWILSLLWISAAVVLCVTVIAASLLGFGDLLWTWWVDAHDGFDALDSDDDETNQD